VIAPWLDIHLLFPENRKPVEFYLTHFVEVSLVSGAPNTHFLISFISMPRRQNSNLRVISCNVNGIRSATSKGFWEWFAGQDADFLCLQEIKAHGSQIPESAQPKGYQCFFNFAERPGYSGVAVYSKQTPLGTSLSFGLDEVEGEGRYLELEFDNLIVASVYLPSGSSGAERQEVKYRCMDAFYSKIIALRKKKKEMILCGDYNIAHKQIDIRNWRGNQKNSGFLPEERAWMDKLLCDDQFVDAFRVVNQSPDQYTWWSNRGQAYAKNVGWRIDYQLITPGLKANVIQEEIYKEQKFSDHAPLLIEYSIELP
jgi:exodeoxyribonuclease-3